MRVDFDTTCPAYNWVNAGDTCKYCKGKVQMYDGYTDCKFSSAPNREPKYKVGDYAYRLMYGTITNKERIRKVEWDGKFTWRYVFGRERYGYDEEDIYDTRKECEKVFITKKAKELKDILDEYQKRYNEIPFDPIKLIENE